MEITSINLEDVNKIATIWMNVFNAPPWNDNWNMESSIERLEIQVNNPYFLGYKIGDKNNVYGFIVARFEGMPEGKGVFIDDLCVSIEWQKQGFGKMLIDKIENYAKENKMRIVITTTVRKLPSYDFYLKNGYIDNQATVGLYKVIE